MKKIFFSLMIVTSILTSCQKEDSNSNLTKPQEQNENTTENGNSKPKTLVTKTTYEVVPVIREQNFYLNSATHLGFGKKTRTIVPVVLPLNTVHFYYSVAVTSSKSPINNLRLATQLSSLLIDHSGFLSSLVSKIDLPEGSKGRADFYLLDYENQSKFLEKESFSYYSFGTREALTSGTIDINKDFINAIGNIFYIGVRNPRSTTGENITIEGAAVVEKKIQVYE
ncbi:MAG: hypothetical protein Q3983_01465 [Capnocytophaga sp.]|nr:hypothetical protein [Capnocytophaga sp.]